MYQNDEITKFGCQFILQNSDPAIFTRHFTIQMERQVSKEIRQIYLICANTLYVHLSVHVTVPYIDDVVFILNCKNL